MKGMWSEIVSGSQINHNHMTPNLSLEVAGCWPQCISRHSRDAHISLMICRECWRVRVVECKFPLSTTYWSAQVKCLSDAGQCQDVPRSFLQSMLHGPIIFQYLGFSEASSPFKSRHNHQPNTRHQPQGNSPPLPKGCVWCVITWIKQTPVSPFDIAKPWGYSI